MSGTYAAGSCLTGKCAKTESRLCATMFYETGGGGVSTEAFARAFDFKYPHTPYKGFSYDMKKHKNQISEVTTAPGCYIYLYSHGSYVPNSPVKLPADEADRVIGVTVDLTSVAFDDLADSWICHCEEAPEIDSIVTSLIASVDPCENNGGCDAENADCTVVAGSPECACRAGFTGDGISCFSEGTVC